MSISHSSSRNKETCAEYVYLKSIGQSILEILRTSAQKNTVSRKEDLSLTNYFWVYEMRFILLTANQLFPGHIFILPTSHKFYFEQHMLVNERFGLRWMLRYAGVPLPADASCHGLQRSCFLASNYYAYHVHYS